MEKTDVRQSDGRRNPSAFFHPFYNIAINYPPSDQSDGLEKIFCLDCLQILNALHMAGGSALKLENRYYNMYFSNVIPERSFVFQAFLFLAFAFLPFTKMLFAESTPLTSSL